MNEPADQPASDFYELVTENVGGPKSWLRVVFVFLTNLIEVGTGPQNPGGMILSVRERVTGAEVFRHVEDMGDDDGHLLNGIQQDLTDMTAADFAARWVT